MDRPGAQDCVVVAAAAGGSRVLVKMKVEGRNTADRCVRAGVEQWEWGSEGSAEGLTKMNYTLRATWEPMILLSK